MAEIKKVNVNGVEYDIGGKLYKHTASLSYDPSEGLGYDVLEIEIEWLSKNNNSITINELYKYISVGQIVRMRFYSDTSDTYHSLGEGMITSYEDYIISVSGYTISGGETPQAQTFSVHYLDDSAALTFNHIVSEI